MSLLGIGLSGIWLIVALFIAILLIWKFGRFILGILANTILGFVTFFLVNYFFDLGIQYNNIAAIVITAVFGLPGAAVIIFLKLIGVAV